MLIGTSIGNDGNRIVSLKWADSKALLDLSRDTEKSGRIWSNFIQPFFYQHFWNSFLQNLPTRIQWRFYWYLWFYSKAFWQVSIFSNFFFCYLKVILKIFYGKCTWLNVRKKLFILLLTLVTVSIPRHLRNNIEVIKLSAQKSTKHKKTKC